MNITTQRFVAPYDGFAECASLPCPNGTTEHEFALVTIGDGPIVDNHRALRLLLCIPCADALAAEAGR